MHVRNTPDQYACLELGILVRPVFTNILFLACLLFEIWFYNLKPLLACLKHGLIIQKPFAYLLACLKNGLIIKKPFAYFLACLKNGLIIQNHLLICLLAFEKWFNNSKPFAYLLACLKNGLIIQNHLLICLLA